MIKSNYNLEVHKTFSDLVESSLKLGFTRTSIYSYRDENHMTFCGKADNGKLVISQISKNHHLDMIRYLYNVLNTANTRDLCLNLKPGHENSFYINDFETLDYKLSITLEIICLENEFTLNMSYHSILIKNSEANNKIALLKSKSLDLIFTELVGKALRQDKFKIVIGSNDPSSRMELCSHIINKDKSDQHESRFFTCCSISDLGQHIAVENTHKYSELGKASGKWLENILRSAMATNADLLVRHQLSEITLEKTRHFDDYNKQIIITTKKLALSNSVKNGADLIIIHEDNYNYEDCTIEHTFKVVD